MAYSQTALGASFWDPLTSAASGIAQGAAAGASGELKSAVVSAINQVLPNVKRTLTEALSDGVGVASKQYRNVLIGASVAAGVFLVGMMSLTALQYNRLGKCCPTGR